MCTVRLVNTESPRWPGCHRRRSHDSNARVHQSSSTQRAPLPLSFRSLSPWPTAITHRLVVYRGRMQRSSFTLMVHKLAVKHVQIISTCSTFIFLYCWRKKVLIV